MRLESTPGCTEREHEHERIPNYARGGKHAYVMSSVDPRGNFVAFIEDDTDLKKRVSQANQLPDNELQL